MKNLLISASLSLVVLSISRCGSVSDSSKLKHDTHQPVRLDSKPWLWANDTEAEYLAMGNPSDSTSLLGPKTFLPSDHALVKRLQTWIDELDAHVRADDAQRMKMVPKPIIHVELTTKINAFVTAIPVCFDNVSMNFAGAKNSGTRDGSNFIAIIDDGKFSGGAAADGRSPQKAPDCRHITISQAELQERVAYLNATNNLCKLTVANTTPNNKRKAPASYKISVSNGCVLVGGLENASGAAVFAQLATSRHVTVLSGILKIMDETSLIAVLAHELGHYYRPHIATGSAQYNFAYDASSRNPSKRPEPRSDALTITNDVNQNITNYSISSSRLDDLSQNIPASVLIPIQGAKYHPTMLPVLRNLSAIYASSSIAICADAEKTASEIESKNLLQSLFLPLKVLSSEARSTILSFEAKITSCLDQVKMTDQSIVPKSIDAIENATQAWKFSRLAAKPIPNGGTLLTWIRQIDASVRVSYSKAAIEPATEFSDQKIRDIKRNANIAIKNSQAQGLYFTEHKLGLYTAEQEADELSGEWIQALHLDVHAPANAFLSFIKLFESDNVYNDCREKHLSDWIDDSQNIIYVSWNTVLLDPHPADCFRVRDNDLEVKAHGYSNTAGGPRAMPSSPSWKELISAIPDTKKSTVTLNQSFGEVLGSTQVTHAVGTVGGPFSGVRPLHCAFDSASYAQK